MLQEKIAIDLANADFVKTTKKVKRQFVEACKAIIDAKPQTRE
jgi:hypothetical protein